MILWCELKIPSLRKTVGLHSARLLPSKPCDAESYPHNRIFNPHFTTIKDSYILAHQTRFSVIFTSNDKYYLTYTYPPHGIDKNRKQHVLPIHWLYRRSRKSVVKTFEFDVIATSHTASNFNMADINVYEHDSFMATPMLKSNTGDQKVCKKKNLSWLFGAKPRDAKQRPSDGFFYPHVTAIKDSYTVWSVSRMDLLINRLDEIQEQQQEIMTLSGPTKSDPSPRPPVSPSSVVVKLPPQLDNRLSNLEKQVTPYVIWPH